MSNWRVVTGEDGTPYLEIDNVTFAVPRTYPTDGEAPKMFLAVAPPAAGVVGGKAPAWLQDMIASTTKFTKDAMAIAGVPPAMIGSMPPQQGSPYSLEALDKLRGAWTAANPSYPKRGLVADYMAVDEPGAPTADTSRFTTTSSRMGTIGGFSFVGSRNVPAGSWMIGNPGDLVGSRADKPMPTPEPEPEPEPGRFQNLDWE